MEDYSAYYTLWEDGSRVTSDIAFLCIDMSYEIY
jgi:hypothetical protein